MRIGVFDSGVGGVTVLRELEKATSGAQFFYFGDTANVPYGTKSETQIKSLCADAAKRISAFKLDALVVACNTASSLALPEFKAILKIPVLSVVDAGVHTIQKVLESRGKKNILILGTKATVRSHIYSRLLHEIDPSLAVHEQACPLLVPLIEEEWMKHPVLKLTLEEYLMPHQQLEPGIALLACTHYPWIQKNFEELLPKWRVLDSAHAIADEVCELTPQVKLPSKDRPKVEWHFSDPDSVPLSLLKLTPHLVKKF